MTQKSRKKSININIKDIIYYGLILILIIIFGSYCFSKAEIDLSQVVDQVGNMVCEMDTKLPSPERSLWYGPDGKHLPGQDGVPSATETCGGPLLDGNFSSFEWDGLVWMRCAHRTFKWGAYARMDPAMGKGHVLWPAPSALPIAGTAALIPGPEGLLGVVYKTQTATPSPLAVGVFGKDGWFAPPTSVLKGQQSIYLGGAWVGDALEIIVVPEGQGSSPVRVRKTPHDHTEETSALKSALNTKEDIYGFWSALHINNKWNIFSFGFDHGDRSEEKYIKLHRSNFEGSFIEKNISSIESLPLGVVYRTASGSVIGPTWMSIGGTQELSKLYYLHQDGKVFNSIEIDFFNRVNKSYFLSSKNIHFGTLDRRIVLKRMWTWYPRRTGTAKRFIREVDGLWITTHIDLKNRLMISSDALFFEPVPVARMPETPDCAGLADGALVPQGEAGQYWLISPGGCRLSLNLASFGHGDTTNNPSR